MNRAHAHGRTDGGFALPLAIFALTIMGVLITGSVFSSRQEGRVSTASSQADLAFYLTEHGIHDVIAKWNASSYGSMTMFSSRTLVDTTSQGNWRVDVTRLADRLFFLSGTGEATRGAPVMSSATRRLGVAARVEVLDLDPPAALVTRGPTELKGHAEVHGGDAHPPSWGGYCGSLTDKPGIMTPDASDVSTSGQGTATGSPPVQQDPTIGDSTFTYFGGLSWADLVAMADLNLPGGTINGTGPVTAADGSCNTSVLTNWGDPLTPAGPCGSYFPIIHVNGYARIQSGGVGQGILLVEDDLDLRGSFVFHGIIIVQGNFETQGSGNRIYGGVYASNADFDNQSLVGGSVIQNSTCAVTRAVLNNSSTARAVPLRERSWVDITSVAWN